MDDDDYVLVEEEAPETSAAEVVTAVTKAPRKKRPSEIAKAEKKAKETPIGVKTRKVIGSARTAPIETLGADSILPESKLVKMSKAGTKATKKALEALTGVVEPRVKPVKKVKKLVHIGTVSQTVKLPKAEGQGQEGRR